MSAVLRCRVLPDTYRDSIELMRVAALIEQRPGVERAALMMGTPANRDVLARAGLLADDGRRARPSDLVIAVSGDGESIAAALADAEQALVRPPAIAASARHEAPRTIAAAAATLDGANLAIISTPGPYATAEAWKALKRGLHVFLFSDNVPIEDEIALKQFAAGRGVLMLGPDCGTAILDGVPLGFANAVRRGRIGLVGASGTGLQEVSCLVDRLGDGVSQVIGVGGRDVDARVGGLMMIAALDRLAADPGTALIVLVSKPPAPSVMRAVLDRARASGKPIVACMLGGDGSAIRAANAIHAATLEDAAHLAVSLARGEAGAGEGTAANAGAVAGAAVHDDALMGALARLRGLAPGRVRGLFSGGTLCHEARLILGADGGAGAGHSAIDLGDDEFTVGRPHPMIDFRVRNEHIAAAAEEAGTAVILLDVVLGYGAHPDPASALVPALDRARSARAGRPPAVVASICGVEDDPQGLGRQQRALAAAGVVLAPSNAAAARLAARLAAGVAA